MEPLQHNLPQGALFHGRYEVVRRVKAGAMGAVYEVIDRRTDRRLALKVMHRHMLPDSDLLARFAQEAWITGAIESDHLVRVLDSGYDAATRYPYLVMELLRGEELGAKIKREGVLREDDVLLFLSQVAVALDKTHAAGIVHRDLKPENLFVAVRDDGTPCMKVLDFGVAKVVARHDPMKGTSVVGTVLYMAPEQIKADVAPCPATDTYALAHVAYTLLVGEPYWTEELRRDGAGLLYTHICAGAPELAGERSRRRRSIKLPSRFDAWFKRATAVRPEGRFQNATSLVRALEGAFRDSDPDRDEPERLAIPLVRRLASPDRPVSEASVMGLDVSSSSLRSSAADSAGDSEHGSEPRSSDTAPTTGMSLTVTTAGSVRLRAMPALPIAILFGLAGLVSVLALLHTVGAKQVVRLAAAPARLHVPVPSTVSPAFIASAPVQPTPGTPASAPGTNSGKHATPPRSTAARSPRGPSSPSRTVRPAAITNSPAPVAPSAPPAQPSARPPRDIF